MPTATATQAPPAAPPDPAGSEAACMDAMLADCESDNRDGAK